MEMIQYIIVGIIILLAIIFVARRIYYSFKNPTECNGGCAGCKLYDHCNKQKVD
ncbi:FeoB-associated Cys-rich membrane protein [Prevotella sp. PINT]|uniref:FeoB-associated Cys-rich membrane protein n=1 Tax=Palleniella intestinalis TaxID=2736291 RepID=UPI001553B152|nr:FeoB-associated Cys-rich membrane protein [Palleniella intestinalis]NPD80458.1 FeoB-associated Cys-rich membrane protein [Palleniella intestinalis]